MSGATTCIIGATSARSTQVLNAWVTPRPMSPPNSVFCGWRSSRYSAIFHESRTTVSPSRRTGTVFPCEKAMAALSDMHTGCVSNARPLCASAMRVRQEKRL
jgi:hypothetical protein